MGSAGGIELPSEKVFRNLEEIKELLESIRLRVPKITHNFSDLEAKSEKESDVEY